MATPPVAGRRSEAARREPVREIQGLVTIAGFRAGTDSLIYTTSDVAEIQELLRTVGIREAIRRCSGPRR
jgi:enoyl-CoA hydratase